LLLIVSLQEATCEWQGGTSNCRILPPPRQSTKKTKPTK
jgi:hypothetical protein